MGRSDPEFYAYDESAKDAWSEKGDDEMIDPTSLFPGPVPTQTCLICGTVENVKLSGNGPHPPDAAKRRLAKKCKELGHRSKPYYLAGFQY